jgi:hypothetical protein
MERRFFLKSAAINGVVAAAGAAPPTFAAVMKRERVITVRGEVTPMALGGVLIHEHLLLKHSGPVAGNNAGVLYDRALAIRELAEFVDLDLHLGPGDLAPVRRTP